MTIDLNAQIVDDNSNLAVIENAINLNGGGFFEANLAEGGLLAQIKACELGTSDGTEAPAASGNAEASVYGDIAFEASGMSTLVQAVKMVTEICGDSDQFQYNGIKSMGAMAKASASKPNRQISGNHVNDIFARASGVCTFNKGATKGIQSSSAAVDALHCQLNAVMTKKAEFKNGLGLAQAAQNEVGGQKFQAQQGPSLGLNNFKNGPTFTAPKDEVIDDDTSCWA